MRSRAAVFAVAVLLVACSDDAEEPTAPAVDSGPLVVALDGRPSAIAAGDGVLWVADDERGVVLRLDATDGSPIGEPIAVSPTPRAVAVGTASVWVADSDGTVTRIDPESGIAGPPIAVGGALVDVIADGDGAWVGDIEAGTVRAIGPDGGVGPTITVPDGVVRLARAGRQLWVTGLESTVTPIDVLTSVVGTPIPVGTGPIGMAVDDDVLWVTNSDDRTVSRLDAGDGRSLGAAIDVGPAPIAIVVDGESAWVLNQDGPSVTRLDDDPLDLPARPRGMAATDAGIWIVGVDPSSAVLIATDQGSDGGGAAWSAHHAARAVRARPPPRPATFHAPMGRMLSQAARCVCRPRGRATTGAREGHVLSQAAVGAATYRSARYPTAASLGALFFRWDQVLLVVVARRRGAGFDSSSAIRSLSVVSSELCSDCSLRTTATQKVETSSRPPSTTSARPISPPETR